MLTVNLAAWVQRAFVWFSHCCVLWAKGKLKDAVEDNFFWLKWKDGFVGMWRAFRCNISLQQLSVLKESWVQFSRTGWQFVLKLGVKWRNGYFSPGVSLKVCLVFVNQYSIAYCVYFQAYKEDTGVHSSCKALSSVQFPLTVS